MVLRAIARSVLASQTTTGGTSQTSTTGPAQTGVGGQGSDLVSEVGDEIRIVVDRWSVGQLEAGDLLVAAAVLTIAALAAVIISRLLRRVASRRTGPARAVVAMSGLLGGSGIMLLGVSVALEILGFSLGPVLIVILVAIVVLLLLRPLVTNLSYGLLLQMRGALRASDLVEVNGTVGVVTEINARSVVLRTSDGREVRVPNSTVLEDSIENYSTLGRRRSAFEILIRHDTDVDDAIAGVLAALEPVEGILEAPPPEVQATGIVGRFVALRVLVWHGPALAAQRVAVDAAVRAVLRAAGDGTFVLGGPDTLAVTGATTGAGSSSAGSRRG